ncbi:MAG: Smr/MutS family protein [Rhizobiales bacterium]|nr:Smr/MutS family protein [Hyphomicrobiales bacterium]
MKRPPPDIFVRPRRQRALSEDERQLWESVAKQTKPLRKYQRAKSVATFVIESDAGAKSAKVSKSVSPPSASQKAVKRDVSPPPATLTRRERSQLSRGHKDIDARIDLHGMTQSRAHQALLRFLQQACGDGFTFVLVITGKGRTTGPESERGVLRRQVPQWLGLPEFRSLVVGFDEAHIGHGGQGALYVRLRRRR